MKKTDSRTEFDYNLLRAKIYDIREKYPFAHFGVCGRSWAGRALFTVSVGNTKNASVCVGGVHATEWLTSCLLLRFAERLCEAYKNCEKIAGVRVNDIFESRGVIIVPCVNPDGIEILKNGPCAAGCYSGLVQRLTNGDCSSWNANARGVDINHNFNAGWQLAHEAERKAGIDSPAASQYGGKAPESEPETRALVRLCRARDVRHVVAFHSQGEQIFWKYRDKMPERAELIAKIFRVSSGYELCENEGLAVHAGFKDWFIKEFDRPGFTVEIGKGRNPLPIESLDEIYNRLEEMLVLSSIM